MSTERVINSSFVRSADGTAIAYSRLGSGPALIMVAAALSDRSDTAKLAGHLAEQFTVFNYDRRGRGASTDTLPYAVEREVEDLAALIDAAGGSAYLFGSSSGAVLALDAAARLGEKVKGLFMYEPPFIVDGSAPPMPADLAARIEALVAARRRSDAVKLFFRTAMGIPGVFVTLMSLLMPGWSKMTGMAHTLPYDLAVLRGTQDGKPLPAARWALVSAPILVMVGGKSSPFFHTAARALADLLPNTEYRSLPGRDHSAVVMAPQAVAGAVMEFIHPLEGKTNVRQTQLEPARQ